MLETCQLEMRQSPLGMDDESHPRPTGDGQYGAAGVDDVIFTNSGLGV